MAQPTLSPLDDRRAVPETPAYVVIPFCFVMDPESCDSFLEDGSRGILQLLLGPQPPAQPPYDPLTAWATFAWLGEIEEGGKYFKREIGREERLAKVAARFLSPGELLYVESLAVPKRIRAMSYEDLLALIYAGENYRDMLFAACWLVLLGCEHRRDWPFKEELSEENPMDELSERIRWAFGATVGITDLDDELGWERVDKCYEATVLDSHLSDCFNHYINNGPPPLELTQATIPGGAGWETVSYLVPSPSMRRNI